MWESKTMATLTKQEIEDILSKKERWIALSTLDPQGFPHTIPIGYFLVGDKIVLGCRDRTQKVKNIERDSRVSLMWENGRGKDRLTAIIFQGHARIVRDDKERMELKTEACRQRGEEPPENLSEGSVYIEVTPVKTISWDRPLKSRR